MSDQKPNDRSKQIFVRKGLATPSPETQEELDSLPPHLPPEREDGRPNPGQEPLGESGLEETASAGSLLSVDLRQHTGRAWIEAQKSQSAGQGLTAEVSTTLLLRQGNLPLDTPASETAASDMPAPRDRAQTWRQLREELESEFTPASERDESKIQPLPSWAEIKESLAREIGSPPLQKEAHPEIDSPSLLPPEAPDHPETPELVEPALPFSQIQDEIEQEDAAPVDFANPEPESASSPEVAGAPGAEGFRDQTDSDQTDPEPGDEDSKWVELIANTDLAGDSKIETAGEGHDVAAPKIDGPEPPADGSVVPPAPDLSATEPMQILSDYPGESAWAKVPETHTESLDFDIPDAAGGESEETAPSPTAQRPRQIPHIIGAALGFLATIVIGAGLWFQFGPGHENLAEAPPAQVTTQVPAEVMEAESAQSDTASAASAPNPSGPIPSEPNQGEEPSRAPEPNESAVQAALPSSTATPESVKTTGAPVPGETTEGADTPAIAPSFDLIRIEANGDAVIAGRAEPNLDLILLDKGKPIGATRSNADGEWAFIPDQPLPPGEHEFALVISTPRGEVLVVPDRSVAANSAKGGSLNSSSGEGAPLASESVEPPTAAAQAVTKPAGTQASEVDQASEVEKSVAGRDTGAESTLPPTPRSKPQALLAQALPYGVQLSSNSSRDAAQKSWQGLQGQFPDLLGEKRLLIQEITLNQGGTRFRVQTGFFDNMGAARKLCRALAKQEQDCLVFRR